MANFSTAVSLEGNKSSEKTKCQSSIGLCVCFDLASANASSHSKSCLGSASPSTPTLLINCKACCSSGTCTSNIFNSWAKCITHIAISSIRQLPFIELINSRIAMKSPADPRYLSRCSLHNRLTVRSGTSSPSDKSYAAVTQIKQCDEMRRKNEPTSPVFGDVLPFCKYFSIAFLSYVCPSFASTGSSNISPVSAHLGIVNHLASAMVKVAAARRISTEMNE